MDGCFLRQPLSFWNNCTIMWNRDNRTQAAGEFKKVTWLHVKRKRKVKSLFLTYCNRVKEGGCTVLYNLHFVIEGSRLGPTHWLRHKTIITNINKHLFVSWVQRRSFFLLHFHITTFNFILFNSFFCSLSVTQCCYTAKYFFYRHGCESK